MKTDENAPNARGYRESNSAFPHMFIRHPQDEVGSGTMASSGMTLRDYFAAKAMQEILCKSIFMQPGQGGIQYASTFAEYSYSMADAMLAERAK